MSEKKSLVEEVINRLQEEVGIEEAFDIGDKSVGGLFGDMATAKQPADAFAKMVLWYNKNKGNSTVPDQAKKAIAAFQDVFVVLRDLNMLNAEHSKALLKMVEDFARKAKQKWDNSPLFKD